MQIFEFLLLVIPKVIIKRFTEILNTFVHLIFTDFTFLKLVLIYFQRKLIFFNLKLACRPDCSINTEDTNKIRNFIN